MSRFLISQKNEHRLASCFSFFVIFVGNNKLEYLTLFWRGLEGFPHRQASEASVHIGFAPRQGQPLVEPSFLRVEQALLQLHGSGS